MSFTDLNAVKLALRIQSADTTQDAYLQDLVDSANSELLSLFNLTDTAPTSYTNKYDVIDGISFGIWLENYPAISITSVTVDGTLLAASDYYLKRPQSFGCLARKNNDWFAGQQEIEITHVAGWSTVPNALKRGATVLAISMYNLEIKTGFRSEKIGQYLYTLGSPSGGSDGATAGDFPAQTKRALAQYLRPFAPSS